MLLRSALGLTALGAGFSTKALGHALGQSSTTVAPHHRPRAKRVIMFFQTGGVSHVDSFDPKPELRKRNGQQHQARGKLFGSYWDAHPRGESGVVTTDLFPHLNNMMDDLCIIRSMHGNHADHFAATMHMHTGSNGSALPGIGSWVSHAMGTMNPNLPAHVVFCNRVPYGGAQPWSSGFLPASHQGVRLNAAKELLPNLDPRVKEASLRDLELELFTRMNEDFQRLRTGTDEMAARTASFHTASSMQKIAPALFSYEGESDATLQQYGLKRDGKRTYGWQVLMARRLAEAGVRFIEVIDTGANRNWDNHSGMKKHGELARIIDQPIAALIQDLKQRGMLEDTLIIWATEFGRTPWMDNSEGRGHFPGAFSTWLAGAGVRGGHVHGATNEIGEKIIRNGMHVHDFHATLLHLLGYDHERLTYHHAGRNFRLTDVHGHVAHELFI